MTKDESLKIEIILKEISESLKKLTQIQKERLAFEIETDRKDRKVVEKSMMFQDKIIGKIGKEEIMANEVLKMMGIKEEIEIDSIEGIEEDIDEKEGADK